MEIFTQILSAICIFIGCFFILTSALGFYKMPDFFCRTHSAGIADTAGIIFTFLGVIFYFPLGLTSVKILVIMFFTVLTSVTACHALAKAAYHKGVRPQAKYIDHTKIVKVKNESLK